MFPDQQNQNGVPPQPNQQGQYDVVPPLPQIQNNGHSGHNPYEFIVNPQTAPKAKLNRFGGNGFLARIAVIVGGAIVLIIVIAVVVSLLAPKSPTEKLIAIAQRQQEIIRIAKGASGGADDQNVRNFATTLLISTTSSQQQVTGYLTDKGTKLQPKILALDQNAQADSILASAETNNTYDSAVVDNLSTQLGAYQTLIKTTYDQAHSKQLKQLLQQSYTATVPLAAQAKSIRP